MDRVEKVVDEVIGAYRERQLRLWLANFNDLPDLFGPWAGVVRVSAESYLGQWSPDRDGLLGRCRDRFDGDEEDPSFDAAAEELLPVAQDGLVQALAARQVPLKVAERAREVISDRPPVQQWKM